MSVIARWNFTGADPSKDQEGHFGPAVLMKGATFTDDGLKLEREGFARTQEYTGADITAKSLVAYVRLDDIGEPRPSGSALTLDAINRDEFDGIVFGERADATWMCGSDRFARTKDLTSPNAKETTAGQVVQMVATYQGDGSGNAEVALYRNGELLGQYTQGNLPTFSLGNTEVIFGARHILPGGAAPGWLDATIVAAEIHDEALSADEVKALSLADIVGGGTLKVGELVSLQVSVATGHDGFMRHADGRAFVGAAASEEERKGATFRVVEPLDSSVPVLDPNLGTVSLEAVSAPGHYLVLGQNLSRPYQTSNQMLVQEKGASPDADFLSGATFRLRQGFSDGALLSLAVTNPGRDEWLKMVVAQLFTGIPGAPRYAALVTWKVTPGLYSPPEYSPLKIGQIYRFQNAPSVGNAGFIQHAGGPGAVRLGDIGTPDGLERARFRVVAALEADKGTYSLEAVSMPGFYLTRAEEPLGGVLSPSNVISLEEAGATGGDFKARASFREGEGYSNPVWHRINAWNPGRIENVKTHGPAVLTMPVGAPRYSALATWNAIIE